MKNIFCSNRLPSSGQDWFTRTNYMKKLLHPFDILISIIAAACHDMGRSARLSHVFFVNFPLVNPLLKTVSCVSPPRVGAI